MEGAGCDGAAWPRGGTLWCVCAPATGGGYMKAAFVEFAAAGVIEPLPYELGSKSIPPSDCGWTSIAPLTGDPPMPVAPARAIPVARPYVAASAAIAIACSLAPDENADPLGEMTLPPMPFENGELAWTGLLIGLPASAPRPAEPPIDASGVALTGDERGEA